VESGIWMGSGAKLFSALVPALEWRAVCYDRVVTLELDTSKYKTAGAVDKLRQAKEHCPVEQASRNPRYLFTNVKLAAQIGSSRFPLSSAGSLCIFGCETSSPESRL
jgi:hypothetical protein